jgi:hypothetical protein
MTEAEAKKAAAERGWTVEKHDKSYRIVDADGTLVAADSSTADGFGLSLADVGQALAPPG